jgi:ABC-2 type transport system permease protein
MLGNLIKAEYRKIFSVKLWWALLIPTVAVAFLANLGVAGVSRNAFSGDLGESGLAAQIPVALLSLGLSFSFTSIFSAILGTMAVSGEFRHKTITTTYLTSGSRGLALGAKLIVYAVMGVAYGIITLISASLGALAGDGPDAFPSAGSWLLVSLFGVLIITLWTLLGVGLGTLISNQIAVVVGLLIYGIIGETVIGGLFSAMNAPDVTNYLPVGSASGAVISLAIDRFAGEVGASSSSAMGEMEQAFNSTGLPSWWIGGLVFLGYTVVFVLLGWFVGKRRDVN